MSVKLKIAEDLSLPLDAATQTFAFIARKGAGKTYAAGKLVELLLGAGVQVVVIDTVGNWYGLRLAADGKSPGFDVPVLGGLRGDIPLEAAGGALIADIVVDTGRSLVLDASQFSLADRKRFATAFGERLWLRKKGERHPAPLMLAIEESQLIVPQFTGRGDDAARMLGVFEEIIRLGRNYGIGVTMITQRPQSVNKEVLNQTECLCVGQVNGAQERAALKKWITHQGMDVHLVDELPGLKVGTFYVWSPQWLNLLQRVQVLPKRTYDASATPKVGDKRVQRDLKPLDLTELQERLKATIEKAKAEDPRELRKQIAEAQRMLTRQEKTIAELQHSGIRKSDVPPKVVEKPVLKDGQLARAEKILDHIEKLHVGFRLQLEALVFAGKELEGAIRQTHPTTTAVERPSPQARRVAPAPATSRPARLVSPVSSDVSIGKGERIILRAVAQYPEGASREQLTILTGYKRSSRDTYLQRLQAAGLVTQNGNGLHATDAGIATLGPDYEPLPTGSALARYWLDRLGGGEQVILATLLKADGQWVDREAISEATEYKRSSRDTYVQRLQARRLVETERGHVRAAAALFD